MPNLGGSFAEFFTALSKSGAKRVVDVRLNNSSQLAGFGKRDDLEYFLKAICGMDYVHVGELAPTPELLDAYRAKQMDWAEYEEKFSALMNERRVGESIGREILEDAVLLCSEHKAEKCHRRLVAEYLQRAWGDVEIEHL